jgi:2-polyprenyl-3-methyl-5-hydroxy-6-metoxy-1,4-benzoquinol methylase
MIKNKISGEYAKKGEYHKKLSKKWRYYPIYVEKMKFIKDFLNKLPKNCKILDVGCGEGLLVEEFSKKGYNIIGLDLNYSSKYVKKGNLLKMPFKDDSFDLILCLDVLEHLSVSDQPIALAEIKRVLKKNGRFILAIPNLAHFASRISFLFTGRLIRTSEIERHPGDRPVKEYISLLKKNNLKIIKRKGLFPTFPLVSLLTYFIPSRSLWLHKIENIFFAFPEICFLDIFVCSKIK